MLSSIYEGLGNVKVFNSYLQREEALAAIAAAPKEEPVLLLGHGSPWGLLDMRYGTVVRDCDADLLRDRPNLVGIWCYASTYAYKHSLTGFFSGMFISEPEEAYMNCVEASDEEIAFCADDFARRFGDMLRAGKSLRDVAAELMDPSHITSDLTEFNFSRLEYREPGDTSVPLDLRDGDAK